MSERYLKLFTLPENLYAEGSPVIIVAGALHKDNQTGEIFAQLKFKNIQDKVIKALSVSFTLFDSFGKQLGEPQEFQYLDLDFKRDYTFGNKIPVYLTNANVRSYSVKIKEVAFSDGSFVTPTSDVYDTLPNQKYLVDVLGDSELVKQYTLDVGNTHSVFEPIKHKDLWFCTCGEYNRIGEACHNCDAVYDVLVNFDLKQLEENMSERLEEEARQAEISRKNAILAAGMSKFKSDRFEDAIEIFKQIPGWADANEMIVKCENAIIEREEKAKADAIAQKIKAKKKHRIKVAIGIFISLLIVAAIVVYIIFGYMPKLNTYNQAVAMMESGSYEQAIEAFNQVIEFKDSETKIKECQYAYVRKYYNNTNAQTYNYLKELKSSKYLDSADLYEELYAWKATIVINSTRYDFDTDKSSIKVGEPICFNVKLSGGTPGATIMLSYIITYPDGSETSRKYLSYYCGDGYDGYVYLTNRGYLGTYKITVYDGDKNVIGTDSVKITN